MSVQNNHTGINQSWSYVSWEIIFYLSIVCFFVRSGDGSLFYQKRLFRIWDIFLFIYSGRSAFMCLWLISLIVRWRFFIIFGSYIRTVCYKVVNHRIRFSMISIERHRVNRGRKWKLFRNIYQCIQSIIYILNEIQRPQMYSTKVWKKSLQTVTSYGQWNRIVMWVCYFTLVKARWRLFSIANI